MRNDDARPRKRRRPPLRRKTVRWSAKEVDALLAGVRVHGVGKWAAILRHSPVFNGVRTSVDLKDKWRNLTSPVRAAALNTRDHSSNSAHPLVSQAHASVEQIQHLNATETSPPDLSKSHPHQQQPHTEPSSDHNHLDSEHHGSHQPCSQPILDSPSAQEAPMSPIQSQEDVQQSLDDHTHRDSSAPKPHSKSDLVSPPNSDCNNAKRLRPDHSHVKSPTKLEPKLVHYPRNSQVHPLHPPSESSVSPEVLSNPPQTPFSQSPHLILPQTHTQPPLQMNQYVNLPQHPTSSQLPVPNVPGQQQVTAMQQFMNQSLYQSAAVLADYWRHIGHDPTAYAVSGAPIPAHLYHYYAAKMGSLYNSDDDDDDDDDHITPILTPYPYAYTFPLKKSPLVSETKAPLSQYGLRDENTRATASRSPSETVKGENTRQMVKEEQVMGKLPGVENTEMKQSTTGSVHAAVKQTSLACSGAGTSGANPIVMERADDGKCQKSEDKESPSSGDNIKKELDVTTNTSGAETASSVPDIAAGVVVGVCAKPVREPDLKPVTEQAEFDSVTDDVGYFQDADFTGKSQQVAEQVTDENCDGEIADQGPMGMAPLSFPGLGVEEQRQFSVTDLV